jgi:hypothetical protein
MSAPQSHFAHGWPTGTGSPAHQAPAIHRGAVVRSVLDFMHAPSAYASYAMGASALDDSLLPIVFKVWLWSLALLLVRGLQHLG